MAWIYSEPFLWHCQQDQIAGFFASCGLAVLEDIGLDTVKVKDIDIFTEANQAYLEALTQRLQGFKPTRGVEWEAEAMYEYAEQHDSPEMKAHNEFIKTYTAESERARASMS